MQTHFGGCPVLRWLVLLTIVTTVTANSAEDPAWLPFVPPPDPFTASAIDLRFLNEKQAGEKGFIGVKNGDFIHTATGEPVRFWAVNGPPSRMQGEELRQCARMLAKRGVNLVRLHGGYFNDDGEVNLEKVRHTFEIVDALKTEGIYSHLSIYFPLWIRPKADAAWLKGYDGTKHPFAALFFNPGFQEKYRSWWTALLNTKMANGKTLVEEAAVAAVEIQNEDSLFFWTFSEQNLPDPQLRILEELFADWLTKKHGSLDAAFQRWNNVRVKRDAPSEGRVGFRPLWNIFNEKTLRDQETAAFLFELQSRFYSETYAFLRKLGFKAPITASNWSTASPEVFGPLEKLSYTTCDFLDRHGYFGCLHKGENAEWSIRNGHTYADRSAYRFEAETPGKPKVFVHPAMDVHYNGKPSMISETTWTRPNRFRSESPVYLACYGSLQHSDAIVHFALDGAQWKVKPNFWMQPWTLMSPSLMGQFPAAALIYRKGLVAPGDILAQLTLNTNELLALKGTPLPQEAALDELRLKEVPSGSELKPGQRIDPLIHYAGRTEVQFSANPTSIKLKDLKPWIDHTARTVTSSTSELKLDYGNGVLLLNAPGAQGVSGALGGKAEYETRDLQIRSDMSLGHIIAVTLDGAPLATSQRILLQVMSEEQTSGFSTEPAGEGIRKITNIGTDPWLFKELRGQVKLKRRDAKQLKVAVMDLNGYPLENGGPADEIHLRRGTVYYLIAK